MPVKTWIDENLVRPKKSVFSFGKHLENLMRLLL